MFLDCILVTTDPPVYTVVSQFDANIGSEFTVNLRLDALPVPGPNNFSWTFNELPLTSSERISFSVDTITFTGVVFSDGGVYSVMAINDAGSGSARFTLVLNGRLDCMIVLELSICL